MKRTIDRCKRELEMKRASFRSQLIIDSSAEGKKKEEYGFINIIINEKKR